MLFKTTIDNNGVGINTKQNVIIDFNKTIATVLLRGQVFKDTYYIIDTKNKQTIKNYIRKYNK